MSPKGGKMSQNRIIYQNWLVELGAEPKEIQKEGLLKIISLEELLEGRFDLSPEYQTRTETLKQAELKEAVASALKKLSEEEQEFIIRFYYMGESYATLAELSNRSIHKLSVLNKKAIKKLKKQLAVFVQKRFGIKEKNSPKCSICLCDNCAEINRLIQNRDKTKTWRPILKILREQYNLKFKSVQAVIGHEKYHI